MSIFNRDRAVWMMLIVILGSVAVLRLGTVDIPMTDRTVWKEADYVQIAANYAAHDYNLFEPRVSWPADGSRITALELPLVPYATSVLYGLFGNSEITTRLVPLLSWLVVGLYTFLLTRREFDAAVALTATLIAMMMAYAHYFGTFLFSEPTVIACSVGAVFHAVRWRDEDSRRDLIVAALLFSLAVALKLTPLYMALPILHVFVQKNGINFRVAKQFTLFMVASLILPIAWYAYAYQLAIHHNDFFGVFGGLQGTAHDKFQMIDMLSSIDWYRIMYWRMAFLVFGKIGALLLVVGIALCIWRRKNTVYLSYFLAIIAFFFIVAEGQIDAPYRQLTIIVPTATFLAVALVSVSDLAAGIVGRFNVVASRYFSIVSRAILPAAFLLMAATYSPELLDRIYRDPLEPARPTVWTIGKQVELHSSDGDLIVTAGEYSIHEGGNDLSPLIYYYSNRRGWSLQQEDYDKDTLEDFVAKGAILFVARNIDREESLRRFVERMSEQYAVLARDEELDYVILDLKVTEQLEDFGDT